MISVIIPALNAMPDLAVTLAALTPAAIEGMVREVIVVDGGSSDEGPEIAEAMGAKILAAPRGRGPQLQAGAAAARGEWLLFLHADTVLASNWAASARAFIGSGHGRERAAAFRLRFDDPSPEARRVEFWVAVRCALLRLPYGDQGLLISRSLYDAAGGYAPLPFLEDIDFIRRLGRRRIAFLPAQAVTSAAKYRRDGWRRRTWRNLGLVLRYYLGASPERLARFYE